MFPSGLKCSFNKIVKENSSDVNLVSDAAFILLEQAALAHWPIIAPYFVEEVAGYKEGFRADVHLMNANDFTSKCNQIY